MSYDPISEPRGSPEQCHLAAKEERRFLSILLRDKPSLMDAISFGFKTGKSGHFWDSKTRFLFENICDHYKKHQSLLTRAAMESRLEGMGRSEEDVSAGMSLWSDTWSNTEASVEDYAHLKNQINNRFIQWVVTNIIKNRFEPLQEAKDNQMVLVRALQQEILAIDCFDQDSYTKVMGSEEGYKQAIDYIAQKRENPKYNQGVLSGIRAIDEIFNGFDFGTYTVISGMINGGKTTLMMNMANCMAKAGYHVVYISLEKTTDLYWRRQLCLNASYDYNHVKRGGKGESGVTDFFFERLQQVKEELVAMKQNYECIQFQPKTKLPAILAQVDRIRAVKKIDVLFVDYLGAIGWDVVHQGRSDLNIAEVHQQLMAYGKQHHLVLITASQLKNESTRTIRKQAKKAVSEGDITSVAINTEDYAESQRIVGDADNAIGLVIGDEFPPTSILLHVSKARDDYAHKTIKLLFDGAIGKIYDQDVEPSDIAVVEEMVYDTDVTKEKLISEKDLFSEIDEERKKLEEKSKSEPEETIEAKPEIKLEAEEIKPEEIKPEEKPEEKTIIENKPEAKTTKTNNNDLLSELF